MEELMEFMRGLDWSPLLISLKTGVVATILSFFGGIFAARQVIKAGPKTKAVSMEAEPAMKNMNEPQLGL